MNRDFDALRELNARISIAEEKGDRAFFERNLAAALAFRRVTGQVVDRATFLSSVKESSPRPSEIESISLVGKDRALVTCIVTTLVEGQAKQFHNLRLFVRDQQDQDWKLLSWANELIG